MDQDLSKMKVSELREALKAKGLITTGNKQDLIDRLQPLISEGNMDSKFEDDLLNDDDLDNEEKSILNSTNDLLKSPDSSKSETSESQKQPNKKISLKRNACIIVPNADESKKVPKEASNEESLSNNESNEPEKKIIKISELSAKDRLEMRAKKFGGNVATTTSSSSVPSLSKLDARASRFGISSSNTNKTSSSSSEVLKKRAERFGSISTDVKKTEYEEKLLKRKERFGMEGKVVLSNSLKQSDYAERAKQRLERFKQST